MSAERTASVIGPRRARAALGLASLVALATAGAQSCATFTEAWQLTDFRILGVRAYAETQPERNSPRRGESAVLELSTADVRARNVRVAWLVVNSASFGAPMASGDGGMSGGLSLPPIFLCDSADFALDLPGITLRCGTRTSFTVPSTGGPDSRGRESLTIFGVACAGGRIRVRPTDGDASSGASAPGVPFECLGSDARGWPFQYTMLVGSATGGTGNDNMHPRIVGVRAGVMGGTLTPVTDTQIPRIQRCADQSTRSSCTRLRVEADFNDGARERYPERDPNTNMIVMRDERLVTGFIVSAGRLSGGFRTDTAAEPQSVMGNDFLPPKDPGDVRMIIYATDGRGGYDTREITIRVD